MSHPITHIARHILERTGELGAMKLQKLTFYCQGWALALNEKPLFNEDFHAWDYGPVCPKLYKLHNSNYRISQNDIPEIKGKNGKLTPKEEEIIDEVVDSYGKLEMHELSGFTNYETPWVEAREKSSKKPRTRSVVSKNSMKKYFGDLHAKTQE